MCSTRRSFLQAVASGMVSTPLVLQAARGSQREPPSQERLLSQFLALPGDKAVKIFAPAVPGAPEFLLEYNSAQLLFIGSAVKTFLLGEALKQVDSATGVDDLSSVQLTLDNTVWSIDSPMFNPPNLTGLVSERTALEAMIMHSDNTATDMMFKYLGADTVRAFIAAVGLKSTFIPDSTRALFGYIFGAPDYLNLTYQEVLDVVQGQVVHSPLNSVETMASTADDMVSYYSRALQGELFSHPETLTELRRILSLGDAIYLLPLPLGVSAYVKGGSIDVPGFHAVCAPGGMFFSNRWVYFTLTLNWYTSGPDLPTFIAFAAAGSQLLAAVKDLLSGEGP